MRTSRIPTACVRLAALLLLASSTRSAFAGVAFCDPGASGVIACPCANPPSGAGLGCDNSSSTGGASLTDSGTPGVLPLDSLVFTTAGERPTTTSILLQGSASVAAGAVFGQGVRCVGGSLKRLYVKNAVAGSITVPAGLDPSVSVRSATLGDALSAGLHRYYQVYYRDPVVLGGCPATSTYNITNAIDITWS